MPAFLHGDNKFNNEKLASVIIKPMPILEANVKEITQYQRKPMGIDTKEDVIDKYIEDIFLQIRPRKEQFL